MKITIVGAAGGIGSSAAYSLALSGVGDELVLVDRASDVLQTHIWDLEQLRVSVRPFTVRRGSLDDMLDSDVVVITASVPPRKGSPRIEFLADNLAIITELAATFADADGWHGVVLIATNPVDPLVTMFHRVTGIDRRRVLGYTVNDTLRLRYAIADALTTSPHSVTAWVVGEHGDHCVALFDRVTVAGHRVSLSASERKAAMRYLLDWYPRWVNLRVPRTSTWTSGHGIAAMVGALASAGEIWPASVVLDGEYGVSGTAVSVPVELGTSGVERVLRWDLAADELSSIAEGARFVESALHDALSAKAADEVRTG